MSSIQVGVRCRPWTLDDKLGVHMIQNSESEGEINLLNSDYSTKRFPFSFSWWTAFNWKHHCADHKGDRDICAQMPITSQNDVYAAVGAKIKEELYDGNAIVLFAYGLSGSGKTFTVFGMDAVDNPDSWFHQPKPHDMWGLFPNLAYQLFQDKTDGWKVTMKYFQNVVDIVRDLMSPTCEERSYKEGMKKDEDGFMDINWCSSAQVNTWEELTKTFLKANAKKAIAPTQFNHQSTRGHCIMVLEVLMPGDDPSMKKRGRIYVCDLAGTEPAGDIVYAQYENVKMPDGTTEKKYIGPHRDSKKTKELQDQGKKINLSLSEMAQFFMKMADAFKKKKLKPGVSIPGCNSYFLCKFLKDTLLQSKTYLFCAIRPEVTYLKYTFATLGFAKNASVVQLAPKKATTAATPAERKLMEELEKMKRMYAELEAKKKADSGQSADTSALAAELEAARAALNNQVSAEGADQEKKQQEALQKQAEQYAKRGITLAELEPNCQKAHFINLDEDSFRSNRFLYVLKEDGPTVFGPKCDIAPPSFSVKKNHCTVQPDGDGFCIIGGKGETVVKGKAITEGDKVALAQYDWVSMGTEVMIFRMPGWTPTEMPESEEMFDQVQECIADVAASGSGGGAGGAGDSEMAKRIEELEKANAELKKVDPSANAVADIDEQGIIQMYKRCKDVARICMEMDRDHMIFEPALMRSVDSNQVKVTVKITEKKTRGEIVLGESDFGSAASLLADEKFKLQMAFENDDVYEVPEAHDPLTVMFDNNCFHLGTAVLYPEYLLYNMETDPDDISTQMKKAVSPYDPVGLILIEWLPLGSEDEDAGVEPQDIEDPSDLLGKSWTGKLVIKKAVDLPVMVDQAYVQYEFWGADGKETFTSENVSEKTHSPTWEYTRIHHVPVVQQEFIDFLSSQWHVHLFVSPYVKVKTQPISTNNPNVRKMFGLSSDGTAGEAAGNDDKDARIAELERENSALREEVAELQKQLGNTSSIRSKLVEAQETDAALTSSTP